MRSLLTWLKAVLFSALVLFVGGLCMFVLGTILQWVKQ